MMKYMAMGLCLRKAIFTGNIGTWWLTSRFRSEFHLSFTRPCHEFIRAFFGISMELFRMAVLGKPPLDSPKSQDDWIWSNNYEKFWWSSWWSHLSHTWSCLHCFIIETMNWQIWLAWDKHPRVKITHIIWVWLKMAMSCPLKWQGS